MHGTMLFVAAFLFGSVIGSFLNVCIYRIPRRLSIVVPSSRCPLCNNHIQPRDNIPLLSYILLKGKCRFCKERISFEYPLVEFLNAVLYVIILWRFGPQFSGVLLIYFIFVSSLIIITFIDLEHQIIPNVITLPGIVLSLIFGSMILPDPFSIGDPLRFNASIAGILLGGGLFYAIGVLGTAVFKKEAMGGGDIKMMAMIGGFLGWKGVVLTTFLGSLLGSIVGISLIMIKGRKWGSKIPFGPYLAFGAIVTLLLGQKLLMWYLHFP